MKDKIIELKNVYFKYPQAQDYTLNDISLEISKGEFIALLGSNGSGKSTFSKLLNSIFIKEKGQVIIDGLDTSSPDNTVSRPGRTPSPSRSIPDTRSWCL